MALKLRDFYQGDTRRYRLDFPVDIAGSEIWLIFKSNPADAVHLLAKQAVLDPPDAEGKIFGAYIEVTDEESAQLPTGSIHYGIEHTTSAGDVATLIVNTLKILVPIRRGV